MSHETVKKPGLTIDLNLPVPVTLCGRPMPLPPQQLRAMLALASEPGLCVYYYRLEALLSLDGCSLSRDSVYRIMGRLRVVLERSLRGSGGLIRCVPTRGMALLLMPAEVELIPVRAEPPACFDRHPLPSGEGSDDDALIGTSGRHAA